MLVTLACWGDWHTDIFRRYGAPSLLRNLAPDDEVLIYTRRGEGDVLKAACPRAEIHYDAGEALSHGYSPVMAQCACWNLGRDEAKRRGQAHAALWPDIVIGDGTFDAYRAHLAAGRSAIYHHMPRVTLESAQMRLGMTDRQSMVETALTNEHHLSWIYRADGNLYPEHAELVNWTVPGGILSRMIAAAPVVVDPRRYEINEENQMLATMAPSSVAVISGSDEAIALSLTPRNKDASWIPQPHPFSPSAIEIWARGYASPANALLARRSYRLGSSAASNWQRAEEAADALMDAVFGKRVAEAA